MKSLLLFLSIISFNFLSAQWTQAGLDIDGVAPDDRFGTSVSMADSITLAIGAIYNDSNGLSSGQVRIYKWYNSTWNQKGAVINGEAAFDFSGFSVSMPDSNTVAIGAIGNDGSASQAGHVRIYKWTGTNWLQKGVDIDGEIQGDESGWSVSMPDSNTVAIGAPENWDNGTVAGHARVFKWNGNAWLQKGLDLDGEAAWNYSGYSVSMADSNTLAIGAPGNDGNGSRSGHVRVYKWNGISWIQKGIDIDGEVSGDDSGWSVSMADTNTLAVGAPKNDGNGANSGHVRIYTWNGTSWQQKGADIDGEATGDFSGFSVSMADTNTLAIGARNNDGNGARSGHVRIYEWNGTSWLQKGSDIDGENTQDQFGFSVSMGSPNTFAAGAPYNSVEAGHARIYQYPLSTTLNEAIKLKNLSIYPNPAKSILFIESANALGERVQIFNLIGTVVKEFQISTDRQQVDLSGLSSGIYFIKFKGQTQKLIISK